MIYASPVRYTEGWKYRVERPVTVLLPAVLSGYVGGNDYVQITERGELLIARGYAWDGPSGPAIDTRDFMRGSLVHDALYQLMGTGVLPVALRKAADRVLVELCAQDGMPWIRRQWVYAAVRAAGPRRGSPLKPIRVAGR